MLITVEKQMVLHPVILF